MDSSMLALALACLAIFFTMLSLVAMLRLYKAIVSHLNTRLGVVFYSVLFITVLTRTITFSLLSDDNFISSEKKHISEVIVMLMISLPEMLNISVYLFLCWFYYASLINSYTLIANDLSFFFQEGYFLIQIHPL